MTRTWAALITGIAALLLSSKSFAADCSRVVSLAPSVTETLFALGLGERVVGVSKYSEYPPEAKRKPRVGGLLDPNLEAIVALKPTLVVLLSEFREKISFIEALGLKTLTLEHRTTRGILESISTIGDACDVTERAQSLRTELAQRMDAVKSRVAAKPAVRTMVVIGESGGDGSLKSFFLSGKDGFYDEILRLAGGTNVVEGMTLGISSIAAEGVITLNPDVIIEIVLANGGPALDHEVVRQAWQQVPSVSAVKSGRIHIIDADYVSVPGPRFVRVLEDFARFLHPE